MAISWHPSPARGFALIDPDDPNNLARLAQTPRQYASFDPGIITWKMDAAFREDFPSESLLEQVRAAAQEWTKGANDPGLRFPGYPYSHRRANPGAPMGFFDLRSVALHELGHVLGAQHPDAAWWKNDYQQNFVLDDEGNPVPQPPMDTEVMVERAGDGKEGGGMLPGEYRRVLSKDELQLLDYVYPDGFELVEVGPNDPADIVVTGFETQPTSTLGKGGPDLTVRRVESDPTHGRKILGSTIKLAERLSFSSRATTIEIDNDFQAPIDRAAVAVYGTDTWPWTLLGGDHHFTAMSDFRIGPALNGPNREEWEYFLLDPVGGSIPVGETVTNTFVLDVWDWTVRRVRVRTVDGAWLPLGATTTLPVTFAPLQAPPPDDLTFPGLRAASRGPVSHRGFAVVNATDVPVTLTDVRITPLPARGWADLSSAIFDRASAHGSAETLPLAGRTLAPGERLYVLLSGDPTAPPEELAGRNDAPIAFAEVGLDPARPYAILVASEDAAGHSVRTVTRADDLVYDARDASCDRLASAEACCEATDTPVVGSDSPDALHVTAEFGPACVLGFDGSDALFVDAEASFVAGGTGPDLLQVTASGSRVRGEAGCDLLLLDADDLDADGGSGDDLLFVSGTRTTATGGRGDDLLFGSLGNDRLSGGRGHDVLVGDAGDDDLEPGPGFDLVDAGDGDDVVRLVEACDLGPKFLSGGPGHDVLVLPVPFDEATAAGMVAVGFEEVVVVSELPPLSDDASPSSPIERRPGHACGA